LHGELKFIRQLGNSFHPLGSTTMAFRPIILIEHQRFNPGETIFDHQPDLTQTIDQDITGQWGGHQKDVSFV
jgi:hypothetical protein